MPDQRHIRTEHDWRLWLANERPSIQTQLHRWLALAQQSDSNQHIWQRCEMREAEIAVLLRDSTGHVAGQCLTIATVRLPEKMQRKGWFKSFLSECCKANPWAQVVIEDVQNPHLRYFLERLKCTPVSDFFKTTYVVNTHAVLALNAEPLRVYESYA